MRKFFRKVDHQIYLLKWFFIRKYCLLRLKFEKDPWKRKYLFALFIGEPFSSRFDLPYPNTIEKFCDKND